LPAEPRERSDRFQPGGSRESAADFEPDSPQTSHLKKSISYFLLVEIGFAE
jgi:hypothetical protein